MILKNNAVSNLERLIAEGYTQQELGDLGGVSRVQVNRILRGHSKPEIDTCEAIAVSLGLPPISLLLDPDEFAKLMKRKLVTSS